MLIDARAYDAPKLQTDVCVVGGGAAGITLARALSASGRATTVIESGGLALTPETDALNDADSPSIEGQYLLRSRRRVLGGTTQHWTGMCLPLDRECFAPRPWVAHSGWPIDAETLDPYYARACEQLAMDPWTRQGALPVDPALTPLDLGQRPPAFETRLYQVKRRFDFGEQFGPELFDSPNVTVFTNATVTAIASQAERVEHVVARTLTGKTVRVEAKTFVLACGGIENARLLLAANETHPGALGRGHANVGRYYMDHPELTVAELLLWPSWDLDLYLGGWLAENRPGFGALFPSAALQRRHRLLLSGMQLGRASRFGAPQDDATDRALAAAAFAFDCERGVTYQDACLPAAVRARMFARCEQAPDPNNRVVLGEGRDGFGNRLPRLEWQLRARDLASITTTTHALGTALYRAGLGRFRSFVAHPGAAPVRAVYGPAASAETREAARQARTPLVLVWGHHMGTARMADAPADGVVDRDCRVHGVDNLFVAGSAVFPTGGAANPTLTIVALALRLADHLATRAD